MSDSVMNRNEIKALADSIKDELPLVEVHILRPTAGELLNRDFHGRHKLITFGGLRRARISTQSIKHAIRVKMEAEDRDDIHTRAFPQMVRKRLIDEGASGYAVSIVNDIFSGKDELKKKTSHGTITSQIHAVTTHDTDAFVQAVYEAEEKFPEGKKNAQKKAADYARKVLTDSADTKRLSPLTALLGRMSTSPVIESVASAVEMGHAYGVNAYAGDTDDFTAKDDYLEKMGVYLDDDCREVPIEKVGSAHLESTDISSNTYYLYASVSERILFENLCRGRKEKDKGEILRLTKQYTARFIKELIFTLPTAKQNTMATYAKPDVVYITTGVGVYPQTMDGAFEKAVVGDDERSVSDRAVERLADNIMDRKEGSFAVNEYESEWWISDRYEKAVPEGVKLAAVKDLNKIV